MTDRDKPCEDRMAEELAGTEQYFADLYRKLDDEAARDDDDSEESLREQLDPLSIDTTRTMRLMFSWGGPSDWIDVELRRDGHRVEVTRVVYHFADWYDHAEREVTEAKAPALWRLAEYHAEMADSYE